MWRYDRFFTGSAKVPPLKKTRDPLLALDLRLPPPGSRTLVRELHAQVKEAILSGRLAPGLRLPATRALAASLGVSRNTVIAVYDLLLGDAYLQALRGSGHQVALTLPRPAARRGAAPARQARPAAGQRRLAPSFRGLVAAPERAPPLRHDFRVGVPEKTSVHFDVWRRLSARCLRTLGRRDVGYGPAQGQPALREAIAAHASFTRAVACGAGDIVVTAGAQQALDLLARILVTPGQTVVAVEDPGYPPARAAFQVAGARIVPVPVDDEGIVVDRLPAACRVVYVTPSHQFPLGCVLSPRRRTELLAFAHRHGAVIVEDDYDGEFRFDGRPLDALQTLDRDESVFFVGTFSKSLFPALRLGFVVAPRWALLPLVVAKERADWHCNLLAQETLAAFMAEGHLARHVRRMRRLYAERRALLLQRLAADFAPWLQAVPGSAGLHLAARAVAPLDVEGLITRSRSQGLGLYSIGEYGGAGASPGLLFGYGAIAQADIARGLDLLRTMWPDGRPAATRRRR
jgi:GntR family transcriptional regulator/MocR family aminotransferase